MRVRVLRCAIEQVVDWHATLFVEPHVVPFVAVTNQYSASPATFHVECENLTARWLARAGEFRLEVSWHKDTAERAERLRATMQSRPLLELASVALGLVLARRVLVLGKLDVTDYGARADYRSRRRKVVLEVSGTEVAREFEPRHRQKVAQALDNPFGRDAYVVVCGFSPTGHRIRFSKHSVEERRYGQG
jgi:hypothetical protein